jgi:hypothetical protein
MGLFGAKKNYATIVAPLKDIEASLRTYMDEQAAAIKALEDQKAQIEAKITTSESEITKSNFTTTQIGKLLASDLDEDGIPDVDELPPEDPEEPQ